MQPETVQQLLDDVRAAFRSDDADYMDRTQEAENVECVCRVFEALLSDSFDSLEEILHPDMEFQIASPPGYPFDVQCQGRDMVISLSRENFSHLTDQLVRILSVTAQGDTVVVIGHETGRMIRLDRTYEVVWIHENTVRDGLIVRTREWVTPRFEPPLPANGSTR